MIFAWDNAAGAAGGVGCERVGLGQSEVVLAGVWWRAIEIGRNKNNRLPSTTHTRSAQWVGRGQTATQTILAAGCACAPRPT